MSIEEILRRPGPHTAFDGRLWKACIFCDAHVEDPLLGICDACLPIVRAESDDRVA